MDEFDSCDSSDEDYEPFDEQSCDDDSDHELVIFDLHLAYYRSVNAIQKTVVICFWTKSVDRHK